MLTCCVKINNTRVRRNSRCYFVWCRAQNKMRHAYKRLHQYFCGHKKPPHETILFETVAYNFVSVFITMLIQQNILPSISGRCETAIARRFYSNCCSGEACRDEAYCGNQTRLAFIKTFSTEKWQRNYLPGKDTNGDGSFDIQSYIR